MPGPSFTRAGAVTLISSPRQSVIDDLGSVHLSPTIGLPMRTRVRRPRPPLFTHRPPLFAQNLYRRLSGQS